MIVLICLVLGVLLGLWFPFQFTTISSLYFSVGILAAIDSIAGAIKASFEEKFDAAIFVSGFFINASLAILLSYLGDKLGVPMYYAAIFVFGTRLFNNIALVRLGVLERLSSRKNK
ncbi:MAG: small basic family protein [Bacillota bacterium]|nr:small basic family protein [Bacillota bacterium]